MTGVETKRPFTMAATWLLTPYQMREEIRRCDDGDDTLADIGRSYNVSHSAISRLQAWGDYPAPNPAKNMRRFYQLDVQRDLKLYKMTE